MQRPPETFRTARLLLRRPQSGDTEGIYAYGGDPHVTRYMDWPTHTGPADAVAFIDDARRGWDSGHEYSWVVTAVPGDEPIGGVACRVRGHSVDLGYVFARRHWGQGHATEAARPVFDWARSQQTVYRVWATCDVDNGASARVLEKIGMSREGILRRWAVRPNLGADSPRDAFVYSWAREA